MNIKKIVTLAIFSLITAVIINNNNLSYAVDSNKENNIALVNMELVFNKYYKTELADKQLKEQADEFNTQRKEMVDNYEKLQQEFATLRDDAQNVALTEEVRNSKRDQMEEKMVALRDQERKIRRFEEMHQKQLQEQSLRMRKKIVTEIRDEINTVAEKGGYSLVLDASGQSLNAVEFVLYANGIKDITEDVVKQLNKSKTEDKQEAVEKKVAEKEKKNKKVKKETLVNTNFTDAQQQVLSTNISFLDNPMAKNDKCLAQNDANNSNNDSDNNAAAAVEEDEREDMEDYE